MKKHIYLCLLLVFVFLTNISAQNLVAYYKLDGDANAFIGNYNGATSGLVEADSNRFNVQNSAMRFVNSYSYAVIPNAYDLPQKTFNFWLVIDTVISNVNILTIDNGFLNHGMVYIQLYRSFGVNKLDFFGGDLTPIEVDVNTKKWMKISITYSDPIYKFYIDNKLIGSVNSTNIHSVDGYLGLVLGNNRAFNNVSPFIGKIDDLSIYDYEMDSLQLANIDVFSSISKSSLNSIKVFPNPTKDFLNINNGNFNVINNYQYIIINSIGQSVFTHVVNSANTLINISTWPEGIYFLNIYDTASKLVEVKKIIIN